MARISKSSNVQQGLKPIFLFMVAAILLSKSQRVFCQDESSVPTESTTESVCPDHCNLAPDRGSTRGKAPFSMWYFDVSEGECKRFRWIGRGGNKNRFWKRVECEETCSKCTVLSDVLDDGSTQDPHDTESVKDSICNLPLDEGKCNQSESDSTPARQPQLAWYFEADKETCSPFVFFGCEGNSNRFSDRKECEEMCTV